MDDQTKNLWDVILNSLALLAAGVAFIFGLLQWRQSQKWQRSEQLDKFVEKFETDELLRLAENEFDVFVTSDQNLRHQQNLMVRRLAIIELPSN